MIPQTAIVTEIVVQGDERRTRTKLGEHDQCGVARVHLRIFREWLPDPLRVLGQNRNKPEAAFGNETGNDSQGGP